MAKEIERKFLVGDDSFRGLALSAVEMQQGYICRRPEGTVRVRIAADHAFLTVKGANRGCVRNEWEYEIPVDDAREMLANSCEGAPLEKTRYIVPFEGHMWEVDCFHGQLEGLVVAEIELHSEEEAFTLPPFAGREVTGDPRYYNSMLSRATRRPDCEE